MSLATCKSTFSFGPAAPSKLSLMGIRLIEGEGGAGGDPVALAAADAANAPWTKESFDPDRAYKLVENLRGDLDKQRTKFEADLAKATTDASTKAAKDALAGIAKLLSGQEEPETDPLKLAAKVTELSTKVTEQDTTLTKAQSDLVASQLATAVAIQAGPLGGSPKLLLANGEFMTSIASVDPTDEAAITAKITAAIQANAALKATPSSSGGSEHQGGQIPALQAQLAAAEKANDYQTVISLKRQIARASTSS
jgi:hypothetical protein